MNKNELTDQENSHKSEDFEKLLKMEKKAARRSGFWRGLLVGLGSVWFFVFILVLLFIINKDTLINESANYVVGNVMEDVFESFPDGYWTNNQKKIVPILDQFTNAAADHRISNSDYRKISRAVMSDLKDRRLTYRELENLLELLKNVSQN